MSTSQTQLHDADALLLVGHGTRDAAGLQEMWDVTRQVTEACPRMIVEHAFLELAEPSISAAMARSVERGARRLVVQPLLLFAAGHAQRDIPEEVAQAASRYAQLEVLISPHLGCHPRLLELSEVRFEAALARHSPLPDAQTLLLLVGRGSRDPEANSEMVRFSRLRWERRELGWVETCFTAMTWPTLADGLAAAAKLGKRRVVVQPHLLFQGELLARVQEETVAAARRSPQLEWLIAEHLGPHPLLRKTILEILALTARVAWGAGAVA